MRLTNCKNCLIVSTFLTICARRSGAFSSHTVRATTPRRVVAPKAVLPSLSLSCARQSAANPRFMATSSDVEDAATTPPDYGDVAKYFVATGIQYGLLAGALKGMDKLLAARTLPLPVVGLLFCFLSLRSRVASVLDNSRPNREANEGKATPSDVQRPSWTPPGVAFPFIWLTITGLRGVSSALVYQQTRALYSGPLLAMILHLSIGDTWNCITNVEKRLGVGAVGVLAVWASVWNAIYRYYQVAPVAGKILSPSGVWISIATVLCWSIWRINKPVQPLWPVKGDGKSSAFKWSNLGQLQATSIDPKGATNQSNDPPQES